MPLQLMQIKPGIVKDITPYSAGKNGPYWIDGNLIRFKNGYAEKIGGWLKQAYTRVDASGTITSTETTFVGIARTMVAWRAITDGEDRIAIGTHNHLYILENNALYDITPLRKTTENLTNPLATTDGSTTVVVTDNSHGATNGDFVVINSATATGGVTAATLNQSEGYQITYIDANSYSITVSAAATSTVSAGGGTTIDIKYLIGVAAGLGQQSGDPALGWGAGSWGGSTWGTPRSVSESDVKLSNSQWSLALWGEDLVATVRGGAIYYYDTSSSPNRAVLVSGLSGATSVPTTTGVSIISFPDRHLLSLGADPISSSGNIDPMLVRWSTQEDFTVWQPTVTNTAGDQRLEIGTKIVGAVSAKDETIIATDEALYGMTFIGPPFVFSFRLLATNCGAGGKNVLLAVDNRVYWMGKSNFFIYDGTVKDLPCPVQHFVFDRMQTDYIDKTVVGHNKSFNEVIWFYVSTSNSAGTENPEPDSYVSFNYQDLAWSIGTLNRTVWSDAFGARNVPFAFDETGILYDHETGTSDNGSAMNSFVESSAMEISQGGDNLFMVDKIIPDLTATDDTSLSLTLKTRKYPNSPDITKGAFTVTNETTKVSTRARARQMTMKLESSGTQDDWQLGDFRINVRQDGLR
tara:strand:+ start:1401 stop:3305 length:1905 start_codon:yes stop_codon:yes gene_type:complete